MSAFREDGLVTPPRGLRMRFADSTVEANFRDQAFRTARPSLLFGLVLALTTCLILLPLDLVLLERGPVLATVWAIRFAWVTLIALALLSSHLQRQWFDRHWQTIVFSIVLSGNLGVMALLALSERLVHHHAALFVLTVLAATILRLNYLAMLAAGVLTLAAFLAMFGGAPRAEDGFVRTVAYLYGVIAAAATAAAFHAEYTARHEYRAARLTERRAERLEQRAAELRQLAETDALTGLLNRRRFLELAEREARRFARYSSPTAVLLFDLDRFKSINDTHGHAVGDEVLKHFAATASAVLRTSDVLGRTGGEEFAAILPETRLREAVAAAERLREAVGSLEIATHAGSLFITVSIGVSMLRHGESTVEPALERADQALYAAKEAGRDCVVVNSDGRLRLAAEPPPAIEVDG